MLPLLLLCAGTGAAAAAPRHNVLFILADDYGWADSGWHRQDAIGRQEVRTPTMDGLIAEGIELDRHYTYKFCSPTRSSLQVLATRPAPPQLPCGLGLILMKLLKPAAVRPQPYSRQRAKSRPPEPQPQGSCGWFLCDPSEQCVRQAASCLPTSCIPGPASSISSCAGRWLTGVHVLAVTGMATMMAAAGYRTAMAGKCIAMDVQVILTPPCIFH
jgi:hypothetical protein